MYCFSSNCNYAPNNLQKDEDVEFFRQKFAGSQADRAEAESKKLEAKLKETKISGYTFFFSLSSLSLTYCADS